MEEISWGGVLLPVDLHLVVRSHFPLYGKDGAVAVYDGLPFRELATRRSPSFVKATTDGVVRFPSELGMMVVTSPS